MMINTFRSASHQLIWTLTQILPNCTYLNLIIESVAVIDTNTDTLTGDISLGDSKSNNLPFNIVVNPNSNKIYVANVNTGNNDSGIVSVISGKNDSILKDVSLPFPLFDIAIDPTLNKTYVVRQREK